jgi:hypothetical protein
VTLVPGPLCPGKSNQLAVDALRRINGGTTSSTASQDSQGDSTDGPARGVYAHKRSRNRTCSSASARPFSCSVLTWLLPAPHDPFNLVAPVGSFRDCDNQRQPGSLEAGLDAVGWTSAGTNQRFMMKRRALPSRSAFPRKSAA